MPVGCSFHPRCVWAVDRCREKRPRLVEVGAGREAACFRSEEVLHDRIPTLRHVNDDAERLVACHHGEIALEQAVAARA